MGRWRAYIKPFDDDGNYTTWVDVSEDADLSSIGSFSQDLDNTDFDIGVYRTSSFQITLDNADGKYSDVGSSESIFRFARSKSLLRVTWELSEERGAVSGISSIDDCVLSEEIDILTGLLSDESLAMDLDQQKVTFQVLGRESILQKALVPFASISDGDLISEIVYACLNQADVTGILVVDEANISLGLDQATDVVASLENKTVQEALDDLLLASNSVLFIDGDEIHVQGRVPTNDVKYSFFGQASDLGPENIQNIQSIQSGLGRVFNFVTWAETTLSSEDPTSTARYGVRKKELSFDFITDPLKRQLILNAIRDEFSMPKQEFLQCCDFDYQTSAIALLDRCSVDYPTVAVPDAKDLPLWNIAIEGQVRSPKVLWAFNINPLDHYKVTGRAIDFNDGSLSLKMRAI